MATASPAPTPNPNAMRFQLDTTLPGTINFKGAADAADHPFAKAVFETDGVAAVFGHGFDPGPKESGPSGHQASDCGSWWQDGDGGQRLCRHRSS